MIQACGGWNREIMIGGSESEVYTNLFVIIVVAMFVLFRLVRLALCKKNIGF